MIVYILLLLIAAFLAYTVGSISTLRLASQFVFRRNLLRLGKGNVWLSNFRRLYGVKGFLGLGVVEIVKDLIPILLGGLLLSFKGHADVGRAFAGFCLVFGRLYPVFNDFRGSHASLALIVAALCCDTSVGIAAAVFVAAVSWFTRYLSLGAFVGAVVVIATAVLVIDQRLVMILLILTALLVILRHVPAMNRLSKGQEPRISFEEDLTYKLDQNKFD